VGCGTAWGGHLACTEKISRVQFPDAPPNFKGNAMINPCKECLVSACCSKRCKDYARYIFDNKDYEKAGLYVAKHINAMSHDDAIDHILKVETIAQYIDNINKQ